jgi:hypothetical protein
VVVGPYIRKNKMVRTYVILKTTISGQSGAQRWKKNVWLNQKPLTKAQKEALAHRRRIFHVLCIPYHRIHVSLSRGPGTYQLVAAVGLRSTVFCDSSMYT